MQNDDTTKLKTLVCRENTREIKFHECLWCTSAAAPKWLKQTPFPTTERGFLQIDDTYQCTNYPGVFAAGDCCEMMNYPRPKCKSRMQKSKNFVLTCSPILQSQRECTP